MTTLMKFKAASSDAIQNMMKLVLGTILAFSSISATYAAGNKEGLLTSANDDLAKEKWAYSLGVQAYVFGLPVVIFEREYSLRTKPAVIERIKHKCPCAMLNNLGHNMSLATADIVMPYTPNNDTVYSGALLEVGEEPVILTMPDIDDRYWSVEVANPYTENQFYIGSRATNGKGGHHAFVGPDWKGTLPEGVVEHRMEYSASMVAVRIGVLPGNDADLKQVNELQKKFYFTSLGNFSDPATHGMAPLPQSILPRPKYSGEVSTKFRMPSDLSFFNLLADLMTQHKPAPEHQAMVNSFKAIGLIPGQPFKPETLDPAIVRGLEKAVADGEQIMSWKVKYRGTPYASKWNNLREGTYNFDYFDRAAGALEGLFVHDREEAVYFSTYESGDGVFLEGSKNYTIHFEKDEIPPTLKNGFWSMTMYGRDFQLVKNDIDRFSIGDRTPDLKYNDDGSLDIYIQSQPPEGKASNWLPSPPQGIFRVNYRIYLPEEAARNPETLTKYTPSILEVK
jgi:hypothetical protein